jgi:hypothetical protein
MFFAKAVHATKNACASPGISMNQGTKQSKC